LRSGEVEKIVGSFFPTLSNHFMDGSSLNENSSSIIIISTAQHHNNCNATSLSAGIVISISHVAVATAKKRIIRGGGNNLPGSFIFNYNGGD
jgi:hypothetical protein